MLSIQTILFLVVLSFSIVPTLQYGTIFTDNISTPDNFTDITETYIQGIKSDIAHANTATVDMIVATNPDGFYINSVGDVSIQASEWDVTVAQSIKFGNRVDAEVELYSAGTFHALNDRTDVDSNALNFLSGKAIHYSSLGSLMMRGESVNIQSAGEGSITGRDVVMSSASFIEFESDFFININSTNGLDVLSKYGSIIMEVRNRTTFSANYINIEADNGVDIQVGGLVTINAYSVLALQAAQFAQITSRDNMTVLVDEGDAEIIAASTASVATDEYMLLFAGDELNLYSLGSSESSIHFVAITGQFQLESFERISIGALLNTFDVDIISAGTINSIGGDSIFTANEQFLIEAFDSINTIAEFDLDISGYDYDASSYNQTTISTGIGSTNFTSLQDISMVSNNGDVVFFTSNDVIVSSAMFTLLQDTPATLSRAEPDGMTINALSFQTSSRTSQFDTNGIFSLGADTISITAQNLDIRSSNGPNIILFETTEDINLITGGTGDIKTKSSVLNIASESDYNTTSSTLSLSSSTGHDILSTSSFLTDFETENGEISSFGSTIVDSNDSVEFDLSDLFNLNSYSTTLRSSFVGIYPTEKIILGSEEQSDFTTGSVTQFVATGDTSVSAEFDIGMLSESISLSSQATALFDSESANYFVGNLITDSAIFTSSAGNIIFNGISTFESGNDLLIDSQDFTATGDIATIQGNDNLDITSGTLSVTASQSTYSASGQLNVVSNSMFFDTATSTTLNAPGEGYFHSTTQTLYTVDDYSVSATEIYLIAGDDATINGDSIININSLNSVSFEAIYDDISASFATTTFSGIHVDYYSMDNVFTSTLDTNINADTVYFNATVTNNFNSDSFVSNTNIETDLFGTTLQTISDTISFSATCCEGYFYSDDQITFDVTNDITIITGTLTFIIPLDGSIYLQGADTVFSASETSFYTSDGDTMIRIHGDLFINAEDELYFDADTIEFDIYDAITVTAAEDVRFTSTDAEVYIESLISTTLNGMTTLYTTPRNIEITTTSATLFSTNTSTAAYSVNTNYLTPGRAPVNQNLGILVETQTNDGNIVLDSKDEIFYRVGLDAIINTAGTQRISSVESFGVTAGNDITYNSGDNFQHATESGVSFEATNGLLSITSGDNQYFEGEIVDFQNVYFGDAAAPGFRITGNSMIVSSAHHGELTFLEECSTLTFRTVESQSWAYTNTFSRSLVTETVTAGTDILKLTSSGSIEIDYDDLAITATTNLTFNSGHYGTFEQEDATYTIGRDAITLSLDGEINFVSTGDQSFLTTGGIMSLESRGQRTAPRDGVYFMGQNVEFTTTGPSTSIFVYAKRSVTFGDVTVPTAVTFNTGGGPTINGYLIASDGDFHSTASDTTTITATDEFTLTTSQGTSMSSGGAMSFTATDGTVPGNILIQSVIGDVFLHSDLDFSLSAATTFTSTATNLLTFTTLDSLSVDTALFQETANSLVMNLFGEYFSTAADTFFDGQSFVSLTTVPDSDGDIVFSGDTTTHTARGNFNVFTFGEDGLMSFKTGVLSISTLKTGDITLSSSGSITVDSDTSFDVTSNRSVSITSNNQKGDDSADGFIRFVSRGTLTSTAADTISFTAERDANILAGDIDLTSTGTFTVETYNDQEWHLGGVAASDSEMNVNKDVYMRNSPGSGGDISIESAGLFDRTLISAEEGITQNINADLNYYSTLGTRIISVDSDLKDEFGIRFQTEQPGANLAIESGNTIGFQAYNNIAFDSTDLKILGEVGVSLSSQGGDLNNVGTEFISATGDIFINSTHSYTDVVGNSILVLANGTTSNSGMISLTASGIDETTSFGMRFTSERGQFMFGSVDGDISVTASESIEFLLDDQYAFGLFGFQRNYPDSNYALLPYYSFLDPYIPSNQIYPYLQSKTQLISLGVNADIFIDTQAGNSDNGQFVAWAGTSEPLTFSHLHASSQLQIVAHGNGDATGDINIIHQNTLELRGSNVPAVVDQRDVFFLANEFAADIDVRTTKNAIGADIHFSVDVLNMGAENKLHIRSVARNGDSGISIYFDRRVTVRTTGHSTGQQSPNSDLPGIEFRTYRSSIYNDAALGDVIYQSLRDMYLVANNGFEFNGETIEFQAGDPFIPTSNGFIHVQTDIGGLAINTANTDLFAENIYIHNDLLGGDITFRSTLISMSAENIVFVAPSEGGKIVFNYNGRALIDAGRTLVYSYMTIPMTGENIFPGTPCLNTANNVASIVIARSPPYDVFSAYMNIRNHPFGYGEYGYDAVFDPQSVYSGLGLRLCSCLAGAWRCMTMSQFYY